MNEEYKVLIKGVEAETELKKSRFIGHIKACETVEEAEAFVEAMKKQFYDARHNPYAYVIGKDGDKVKFSDDGEPGQTAGLPIYNVLKETGVRNVCIVVTRYFGGTLLGAGPLARMYGEAASLALKASEIGVMKFGVELKVDTDYGNGEKIRRYLEKEGIVTVNTEYGSGVSIIIRLGFEREEGVKKDLISLTSGSVSIDKINEAYFIDRA